VLKPNDAKPVGNDSRHRRATRAPRCVGGTHRDQCCHPVARARPSQAVAWGRSSRAKLPILRNNGQSVVARFNWVASSPCAPQKLIEARAATLSKPMLMVESAEKGNAPDRVVRRNTMTMRASRRRRM
jgi:hypothetical protein